MMNCQICLDLKPSNPQKGGQRGVPLGAAGPLRAGPRRRRNTRWRHADGHPPPRAPLQHSMTSRLRHSTALALVRHSTAQYALRPHCHVLPSMTTIGTSHESPHKQFPQRRIPNGYSMIMSSPVCHRHRLRGADQHTRVAEMVVPARPCELVWEAVYIHAPRKARRQRGLQKFQTPQEARLCNRNSQQLSGTGGGGGTAQAPLQNDLFLTEAQIVRLVASE
jgi:hypothetical protein